MIAMPYVGGVRSVLRSSQAARRQTFNLVRPAILLLVVAGIEFMSRRIRQLPEWSGLLGATVMLLTLAGCNPPSDAELKNRFESARSGFETLLRMLQEDQQLVYLDDRVMSLDNDSSLPREDVGLSQQRVQGYRELIQKLGIGAGIQRRKNPSAIFFLAECFGSAIDEDCKGYVYSATPLVPLKKSLDDLEPGTNFEALSGNWCLFREER